MTEATTPARRRRPRGEGSIYVTAAGRARGALIVTDPETGARYRRTVSGRTKAEVRDRLRALREGVEKGLTARPGGPRTLRAFVEAWLPALRGRVRFATWRGHELNLRLYILPALGDVPLGQLTPTAVERLAAGMVRSGRSSTTARAARTTLRLVLRDAERDGLVARNVAALARPPRVERREFRVLTADETRRLLDGTADDALGPLFALAATTGMRQGELLGLRWDDVDLAGGTLTVRRALARAERGYALAETKTARSRRTLELAPAAVAALRRQRARSAELRLAAGAAWQDRDGLVFTDQVGRHVRPASVSHGFADALRRLGLPHVRFHDLRHGAASLLLAQGVPLKVVSETLGHSGITITADTYGHLDREQRRAAAAAIERALGGAS
jgi:integrase